MPEMQAKSGFVVVARVPDVCDGDGTCCHYTERAYVQSRGRQCTDVNRE